MTDNPVCRVCGGSSRPFYRDSRDFYRCIVCSLVFTEQTLPPDGQRQHYVSQWSAQKPGFWAEQADAVLLFARRYREPTRILDFGAGSGGLTDELRRRGFDCTALEPLVNGRLADQHFESPFDLVVGLEVIEHLPNLWEELREIDRRLVPGGVMLFTTMLTEDFIHAPNAVDTFRGWWYKDDPTHVSFFCHRALQALGTIGNFDLDVIGGGVIVVRKPGGEITM